MKCMTKGTSENKEKNGRKRRYFFNKIKKWKNAVFFSIIFLLSIGIAFKLSIEFNKCIFSYIQAEDYKFGANELVGLIASFFAISLLLFEIYKVMNSDKTKRFFSGTEGNLEIFDTTIPKIFFITALFMSLLASSLFFSIILGFLSNSESLKLLFTIMYVFVISFLGFSIAIAFLSKSLRDLLY